MNTINPDNPYRIIIADDHALFRDGLRMLLERDPSLKVIAEARDGNELISLARQLSPDVVLTDLVMPGLGGIEAIRSIMALPQPSCCIALSTFNNELMVVEAMEAGAKGYIIKNAEKGEIEYAIKLVSKGFPYFCKSTTAKVANLIIKSPVNPYNKTILPVFSNREKDIIRLICQEKTSEEIADILCLGVKTVNAERARILEKMNVKTTVGVVIYAIKNLLFKVDY